ncbi:glycosyltransferase [Microcoleus sp. AT9b-C3]|uniref:glycosyltransferase n=1 Tax=Microcoleus sp. AT9b-C3 TaxID=2818629 RepID=UPI002FD77E0B
MATFDRETFDKLTQAQANLERYKNRLEKIKSGLNSSQSTIESANTTINNQQVNSESYVLNFDNCFGQIREPKKQGSIPANNSDLMSQKLRNLGIEVDDYEINVDEYRQYFIKARYLEDFADYYSFNRVEKSLEHYLATKLLKLDSEDIYIDVASETGTVPKIYAKMFRCKTYTQDLSHPPGLNGDIIGGNAADMPLPNEFATKMALHCSFEHFEDDSDIGFVKEAARVLKPGGAVCILPLYLFDEYSVQSDPVTVISSGGVNFEKDSVIYCLDGFNNRHCRFYDPQHFFDRICRNLNGLKLKIYRIKNAKQVDESCYIQFAAVLEKPLDDNTFGLNQETAKISSSQHKLSLSHPAQTTLGTPNQFSSISSKPRIDVVLQATGTHGWNFSRGWVNVLERQGLLNRVFTPVAEWGASEPTDDDGLYEYLKNPEADIMLLLGFDWHSQPLHNNLKWQEQWYNANIKKVAIFQEHCSADIVQNTPQWQEPILIAIDNAATCVSAIICNHEPDVSWLLNRGIKIPTVFSPFAIDPQYYNCRIPFVQRKSSAVFRGNATPHFNNKTYYQRSQLMNRLKPNHHVDLYALVTDLLSKPLDAVQSYVDELNTYKLGLNLPSLSPTLTSRPYEIMGCGTLLLQNHVIGDKSNKLFRDWEHLVYYNPENSDDLIEKIEYLLKNPALAEEIAARGYHLCQEKHTIECRVKELIEWADSGFRVSEDTPKIFDDSAGYSMFPSPGLNKTTNTHGQKIRQNSFLVAVDAIFFQLNNTGIARVWKSLLEEWVKDGFAKDILVLDRAGTAPKISGIRYCKIPEYNYDDTDRDRQMLQQICDEEGADIFISTYYTTPLSTPSVFMGYDMIPELIEENLHHPMWQEKHRGIRHGSAYLTISENTKCDLAGCFPNILVDSITVAHCGIDCNFTPASQEEIIRFTSKYEIRKPYFLVVGERIGWHQYKNTTSFFESFHNLPNWQDLEIVCVGGHPQLEDEIKVHVQNSRVHLLRLSDVELKIAYSGAVALVYPSLYEGFGMPVAEAMACGCPVITCPFSSLPEVGGNAVLYVSGRDVNELVEAMIKVQKHEVRESLIRRGLEQSKQFSWSKMAEIVKSVLIGTARVKEYPPIENTVSVPTEKYKVSAIISTYNSEKYIRGCLQDLVDQTLYKQGELEIVIVDSASQQNEQSIVKEFQSKYQNIVYQRTPERETLYAAWNRAIKMSQAKYITNANTDDRHRCDALEVMANFLDTHPEVSLAYPDQLITTVPNDTFVTTQSNRHWNWPPYSYEQMKQGCCVGSQPMWRKSLHDKYGYFRSEFHCAGDYEFWLRIGSQGENMALISEILGLYYFNPQGIEHGTPGRSGQETDRICDEYDIKRLYIPQISGPERKFDDLQYQGVLLTDEERANLIRHQQLTVNYPSETQKQVPSPLIGIIPQPLVSVIIPTKDRPEMLAHAVQSVLAQTFPDVEIIVVNDGGTDVQEVLDRINSKSNITYLKHDRNQERSTARNTGIRVARGKYIAYLDDDDMYYPNHVQTLVEFLENSEYKVAYTDAVMAEQQKQNGQYVTINRSVPYSFDFDYDKILVGNFIPMLCLTHEKSCLDETGMFDVNLNTHEDWDLLIRLSRSFKIAHIKETTCEFTRRDDSTTTTSKNRADFVRTREIIYNKYSQYAQTNLAVMEAQHLAFKSEAKEVATQLEIIQEKFIQSQSQLQVSQEEKQQLESESESWQQRAQQAQLKLDLVQEEKNWIELQSQTWRQTAQQMQVELEQVRSQLKQAQLPLKRVQ